MQTRLLLLSVVTFAICVYECWLGWKQPSWWRLASAVAWFAVGIWALVWGWNP